MPRVSYKGAAASVTTALPPTATTPLHSLGRLPEFACCILMITSTVNGRKDCCLPNIGYSRAVTYAFFTNLARWKFPYENCLVEISQESYNILV